MGYGFYEIDNGRFGGYMVLATCDKFGCENEIDRGLGYLCGESPGEFSGDGGCGRYFCGDHLGSIGPRGGCSHNWRGKAWGRTLSDLVQDPSDGTYCLGRIGHNGPHAWAAAAA